jgi:hypothetical protein
MRLMGILLLVVALAAGVLAASTAYLVSIDLPRDEEQKKAKLEELQKLTLSADAGAHYWPREGTVPIARKDTHLDATRIGWLQADGIHYVRVREFSLARWPGKWTFAAAVVGLLGGGLMLRSASRRAIAEAGATGDAELPEKALRAILETLAELRRDLAGAPAAPPDLESLYERLGEQGRSLLESFLGARTFLTDRLGPSGIAELHQALRTPGGEAQVHALRARLGPMEVAHLEIFLEAGSALAERAGPDDFPELPSLLLLPREVQDRAHLILARVGELQKTHMTAFVEARPLLIVRLGLGGYAELMDRYAAAERQINRAWSAAADGVLAEAVSCLERASELLDEAAARLAQ